MSENETVHWDEQGQPVSSQFDDVYFSKEDGLAETRYVFLEHNNLEQRFSNLSEYEFFTVAETGFGTGLNFLACWQLWLTTAPQNAQLTFISVEKFPLSPVQMQQALSLWPELSELSKQLLAKWAVSFCGSQRNTWLNLQFGHVRLIVMIDDAALGYQQWQGSSHPNFLRPEWKGIDAWFLDGFAPAKNPDMWSEALFDAITHLSHPNTTFATFTAAGLVRRALLERGFQVNKVTGFGRKREMLCGEYQGSLATESPIPKTSPPKKLSKLSPPDTPWHLRANATPLPKGSTIAVIGAGMAGCHTARVLADLGYQVTLIDRNTEIATEASGNRQGVVYAKLATEPQALNDFNLLSLLFASTYYQDFWQQAAAEEGAACGVLQLSHTEKLAVTHQKLGEQFNSSHFLQYLTPAEASTIAGISLSQAALYFPNSGWLQPRALCRWLTNHPSISLVKNCNVESLHWEETCWQLEGIQNAASYKIQADAVVIANANDAQRFKQTQWLPTKPVRGQVSQINTPKPWLNLRTVICAEGYMAPAIDVDGQMTTTLGASYNLHSQEQTLTEQDHLDNLTRITDSLPVETLPQVTGGRVGFRCTTPDYLPIAGPVADYQTFSESYEALSRNARKAVSVLGAYQPRLFVNIGHGSRGLIYSPVTAALIGSQIAGNAPPVSQHLASRLNPARFLIRDIIRNQK